MKKLGLAGLIVILVGCGEPVSSEVKDVVPEEVANKAPVAKIENSKQVTVTPVSKLDAENYVMKVDGAIDDAQRFNGATDMDNFKNVQKRFTKLRDEGNIFLKGDYDNCGKLGMFPLEILWLRKDNENVEEKMGFYQQFYESCQQQVNATI